MAEIIASIKLFMELLSQARALYSFYKANQNEKWFQDSIATFKALNEAKSVDEKKKAISNLADLWSRVD